MIYLKLSSDKDRGSPVLYFFSRQMTKMGRHELQVAIFSKGDQIPAVMIGFSKRGIIFGTFCTQPS